MEHELISDLSYELVNMAEEGRAVWKAVSTEGPLFYGHGSHGGMGSIDRMARLNLSSCCLTSRCARRGIRCLT
jgi:hypothetical protein